MGCGSSKLEELPAVQLCRHRVNNLSEALHHRFSLSQSHLSYTLSLQSIGLSLHRFFDTAAFDSSASPPPPPEELKDDTKSKTVSGHLSFDDDSDDDDDSGSHLHLHSDHDDGHDDGHNHDHDHGPGPGSGQELGGMVVKDEGGGSGFQAGSMMGQVYYNQEMGGFGSGFGYGPGSGYNQYMYGSGNGGRMNVNYMKKSVMPSVSYEQRPMTYETQTIHFGGPSGVNSNANYYDYFNGGGSQRSGFYGPMMGAQQQPMKKEEEPPPPPPPPAASGWDFMNFFESIDNSMHYPYHRTPSLDSREVREEEGIPDLEDGDYDHDHHDHEVVKEVLHGHQKLVGDEIGGGGGGSESSVSSGGAETKGGDEEVVVGVSEVESGNVYRGRPSETIESGPVEYEVRVVDKKVVGEEGKGSGGGGGGGGRPGFRNVFEVVKEIQIQFERAANCGSEVGNLLEVGKLRYQKKNGAFQGLNITFK